MEEFLYHLRGHILGLNLGAKLLGLGYPGGPVISRLAAQGNPAAIDFPRAMMKSGDYAFSLSGLKTAVITYVRREREAGREISVPDVAASFQQAVIDVQVAKAVRAVKETGSAVFCLGGGVAANSALRGALVAAIEPLGVHVSVPDLFGDWSAAQVGELAGLETARIETVLEGRPVPLRSAAAPGR